MYSIFKQDSIDVKSQDESISNEDSMSQENTPVYSSSESSCTPVGQDSSVKPEESSKYGIKFKSFLF